MIDKNVIPGQLSIFDLGIWSTKMSPEPSLQTTEKTSEPCWKKWQGLAKNPSLFLDLTRGSGQIQGVSSETIGASHGESSMHSFGECHREDEESASLPILTAIRQQTSSSICNLESPIVTIDSHLSDILERNPDPKYNLSAKACQGILNRAERRKKKLPQILQMALEQVIARSHLKGTEADLRTEGTDTQKPTSPTPSTLPRCMESAIPCKTEKEVPGGKGFLIQEEKATSLRTNNYMTLFQPCNWDGGQISPTLTRNNADGCQRMPDKDNFNIQPMIFKGDASQGDDKTFSIVGDHDNRPTDLTNIVVAASKVDGFTTLTEKAQTLLGTDYKDAPIVIKTYQDKVGSLCATDYKGVKNEVVEGGKIIVTPIISTTNAAFHMNPSLEKVGSLRASDYKDAPTVTYAVDLTNHKLTEENGTLQAAMAHNTHSNNVVMQTDNIRYIVRRLTPLECTRLQGLPDGWVDIGDWYDTKGKLHKETDSAKYKALGNGIATPPWIWVIGRLCEKMGRKSTMASLFDGLGSFPWIWENINGKGTCLWASEIEEFPIAVTKKRIGE